MDILKTLLQGFNKLFCETRREQSRALTYSIFATYLLGVLAIGSRHESWFDEAQSWLIAREVGPFDLLTTYIRYEGTPPLWHLMLMLPAKLGMPFDLLFLVSTILASAGVLLLVVNSRLPIGFKVLLPFGFFLFYQYSVVARSYCLVFPLLSLTAIAYKNRNERPWMYLGALIALSWICIHCSVIAGGLAAIEVVQRGTRWKGASSIDKRRLLVFAAGFSINTIALILMCLPPADLTFWGFTHRGLSISSHPLPLLLANSTVGNLSFSVVLIACCALTLYKARQLVEYLVPILLLIPIFSIAHVNVWHSGILFCLLVFALWLSSDRVERWHPISAAALLLICVIQAGWSVKTAVFDWSYPYSGAANTAQTLRPLVDRGLSVEAYGFSAHTVLAYLPKGSVRFVNASQPWHEFYPWNPHGIPQAMPQTLEPSADVLLVAAYNCSSPKDVPPPDGYALVAVHPGFTYWQRGVMENYVYFVFAKNKALEMVNQGIPGSAMPANQ